MAEEEALRSNEDTALDENQIVYNASDNKTKNNKIKIKKGFSVKLFLALILILLLLYFFESAKPSRILGGLIDATDVQYADATNSKEVVFQYEMQQGEVPENTAKRLEENGVEVGYLVSGVFVKGTRNLGEVAANGEFVQSNVANGELVLRMDDKIITADEFYSEVNSNAKLYDAFNSATYSRAAYFYDDGARKAFKQMGITLNNYSSEKSFDEMMDELMGEGNNIKVENGIQSDNSKDVDNGETEADDSEDNSEESLPSISGNNSRNFINEVGKQNGAGKNDNATLNAADTLAVADSISQERRSSKYYVAIVENISKMKAGDGNNSYINEVMNYLYQDEETSIVDTATGEVITVKGSMLQAPSLYSILSGEKVEVNDVINYSSERVLKTIENQINASDASSSVSGTVASVDKSGISGVIGRLVNNKNMSESGEVLSVVEPTISSSLVNNSFDSIRGISGGELLVQGAVNVGATLALQSGSTVGDDYAVKEYARATEAILALDAEVDRMKRSPFDITSKNTFLGSIAHKFAVSTIKSGSFLNKVASFSRVTASSIMSLFPTANADDENISYMTIIGDCEHMSGIGAVGTASCARNETFDMSTLNSGIFVDGSDYAEVVGKNVECSKPHFSGVCRIKDGSAFEKFAKYNVQRTTPVGVSDGSILNETSGDSSGGIISALKRLFSDNSNKDIASGKAFVNSSKNDNWKTYKYAQRYFSIVRATDVLRQYDGGETAYNNIPFVGIDNPVIACLEKLEREEKELAAND